MKPEANVHSPVKCESPGPRKTSSNSHFDSERAHPGRSTRRIPNAAGYFAAFLGSGPAAAWKAPLHLRQNENCWQTSPHLCPFAFICGSSAEDECSEAFRGQTGQAGCLPYFSS
jgi:hypothetical protein